MLHSSEYPRTTFAVLDSMNCIIADNTLDAIFMNLRQFYAPSAKKGQKIEVKGYHHEVKKYVVKFGSIVLGSTHRGIVVEVCVDVPPCRKFFHSMCIVKGCIIVLSSRMANDSNY